LLPEIGPQLLKVSFALLAKTFPSFDLELDRSIFYLRLHQKLNRGLLIEWQSLLIYFSSLSVPFIFSRLSFRSR
jgi:hypothetical protein